MVYRKKGCSSWWTFCDFRRRRKEAALRQPKLQERSYDRVREKPWAKARRVLQSLFYHRGNGVSRYHREGIEGGEDGELLPLGAPETILARWSRGCYRGGGRHGGKDQHIGSPPTGFCYELAKRRTLRPFPGRARPRLVSKTLCRNTGGPGCRPAGPVI